MKEMRFMGSSAVTPAGLFALGGNGPGSFLSVPMTHQYCRTSLSDIHYDPMKSFECGQPEINRILFHT